VALSESVSLMRRLACFKETMIIYSFVAIYIASKEICPVCWLGVPRENEAQGVEIGTVFAEGGRLYAMVWKRVVEEKDAMAEEAKEYSGFN
jgi:hypothetical protein